MKIISYRVKLPEFDDTTDTINIDDTIVAGIEYFFIPKYNGINAMHDDETAFIITAGIRCIMKESVNVSGSNWKLSLTVQKTAVTKIVDKIIAQKVKRTTMASFEAINFFLLNGYINATVMVLYLNSPIMNLAINTLAKIINTALTPESIKPNAA